MFVVTRCAVGRAGEQDRLVFCAFRDQDDGVEFDAVPHGDHDFATVIVEAAVVGTKVRAIRSAGWLGFGRMRGEQVREEGCGEQTSAEQKRGICFLHDGTELRFSVACLDRVRVLTVSYAVVGGAVECVS